MPTIDTDLYDALTAVNVPHDKARAAAAALERRLGETCHDLVTNAELGMAVNRLGTQIKSVGERLTTQIDNGLRAQKADSESSLRTLESELEAAMLRQSIAILLGVLAIGGLLIRFVR